jgi:hypothetical protein
MKKFPKDFDVFVAHLFTKEDGQFYVNNNYISEAIKGNSLPLCPTIVHTFATIQEFKHYYNRCVAGKVVRYLVAETDTSDPMGVHSYFRVFLNQELFHNNVIGKYSIPIDCLQNYAEINNLYYHRVMKKKKEKEPKKNDTILSRFELLDLG